MSAVSAEDHLQVVAPTTALAVQDVQQWSYLSKKDLTWRAVDDTTEWCHLFGKASLLRSTNGDAKQHMLPLAAPEDSALPMKAKVMSPSSRSPHHQSPTHSHHYSARPPPIAVDTSSNGQQQQQQHHRRPFKSQPTAAWSPSQQSEQDKQDVFQTAAHMHYCSNGYGDPHLHYQQMQQQVMYDFWTWYQQQYSWQQLHFDPRQHQRYHQQQHIQALPPAPSPTAWTESEIKHSSRPTAAISIPAAVATGAVGEEAFASSPTAEMAVAAALTARILADDNSPVITSPSEDKSVPVAVALSSIASPAAAGAAVSAVPAQSVQRQPRQLTPGPRRPPRMPAASAMLTQQNHPYPYLLQQQQRESAMPIHHSRDGSSGASSGCCIHGGGKCPAALAMPPAASPVESPTPQSLFADEKPAAAAAVHSNM